MRYFDCVHEWHRPLLSIASNMWRTPCLTILPFATAVTHVYTQRSVSVCQSQRLGSDTVEPTAELKLVQVVFRCRSLFW